jgi:hypothetical protein
VSAELITADLIGKLIVIRLEVQVNPADVMFGGVWMRNLRPQGYRYLEYLIGFDALRTFDHRNMLFGLPVRRLIQFTHSPHLFPPFGLRGARCFTSWA